MPVQCERLRTTVGPRLTSASTNAKRKRRSRADPKARLHAFSERPPESRLGVPAPRRSGSVQTPRIQSKPAWCCCGDTYRNGWVRIQSAPAANWVRIKPGVDNRTILTSDALSPHPDCPFQSPQTIFPDEIQTQGRGSHTTFLGTPLRMLRLAQVCSYSLPSECPSRV